MLLRNDPAPETLTTASVPCGENDTTHAPGGELTVCCQVTATECAGQTALMRSAAE